MNIRSCFCLLFMFLLIIQLENIQAETPPAPDYTKQIAPLFKKYCSGCHNADDAEGGLSTERYADLLKGGKHGPAFLAGDSSSSRLIRMINGKLKPAMPPADSDQPTAAEKLLLATWIDSGAKGPEGKEPDRTTLIVPTVAAAKVKAPAVTALAYSPKENIIAVARFKTVELRDSTNQTLIRTIADHPGKVQSVEFSKDGKRLLTASGVVGLYGVASIWNVSDGSLLHQVRGHRDTLYSARFHPKLPQIITGSYDQAIHLWDIGTQKLVRSFPGHNGAIYDLAFNPDGTLLASASGDETVKIWQVSTGIRLDTLGQPEGEQYAVTFTPDGKFVIAGGADNRFRVWKIVSHKSPKINPLLVAKYAHEQAITQLAVAPDGKSLVTVAEDRTTKLWNRKNWNQDFAYPIRNSETAALGFSPDSKTFLVGRLDGSLEHLTVKLADDQSEQTAPTVVRKIVTTTDPMKSVVELEPNHLPANATPIELPALVEGKIHSTEKSETDTDLYRFHAKAGEQWMVEINAARQKSPLDSKIEILDEHGQPILRVQLQAVRNSYFTFRGKDSKTSDDFRVHNWQEMELNEYLYANGEVVKLWLYPRGPDSGFKVYPGAGNRYNFFDTTPLSHALQAPCYIVRPVAPGTEILPNGLPVFPIYFENDDDSLRQWGSDSRLTFTAPYTGDFLVRVSDSRGFQGEKYKYKLTVRPRKPDVNVTLSGANPKINRGSGKEFSLRATRLDNYAGSVRVDVKNVPEGLEITTPIIIEASHELAYGTILVKPDAPDITPEQLNKITFTATAEILGKEVTKPVNGLGKIELLPEPKLRVLLVSADGSTVSEPGKPMTLEIHPGETIAARVRVIRKEFAGNVSFGKEDSGRNLPHGVYVDNIGLNGLLILPNQNEREFFITAAKWVEETERLFHLKTGVEGSQTSWPVLLKVVPRN